MSKKPKPSGDIKKSILETINDYPGLSLRELSRENNISSSLMKYHIDSLTSEGKIIGIKDNKAIRFFLTEHQISNDDFKILKLLRNPIILEFVILFLETENDNSPEKSKMLRNIDLYDNLRFNSKGTISYYLKKLLEEKIIAKSEKTINEYYLKEPEKIKKILKLYKPIPSIVENFMRLWTNFYSKNI
ncbi:MAG: winged helix-turn-helix transcriptional regulator [Candidatus Hodarchaeales archaeon]|jgi:predicted transcriptional regulator